MTYVTFKNSIIVTFLFDMENNELENGSVQVKETRDRGSSDDTGRTHDHDRPNMLN